MENRMRAFWTTAANSGTMTKLDTDKANLPADHTW
jgi:hypothetical protein